MSNCLTCKFNPGCGMINELNALANYIPSSLFDEIADKIYAEIDCEYFEVDDG